MEEMDFLAILGGHPSGITKLKEGSVKYIAATNLIAVGVDFDSVSAGKGGTIFDMEQLEKKDKNYKVPKGDWVDSARLDSQGDINNGKNKPKYARLAVQITNETHAQANVQIGVDFGKRGIRNALNKSLKSGKVTWLSSNKAFIEKAQSLGHTVMTYEMCQALESEDFEIPPLEPRGEL